jgi:hypothetical protein
MPLARTLSLRTRPDDTADPANDMATRRTELTNRASTAHAPIWEPTTVVAPSRVEIVIPADIEASIIATLTRGLRAGETHQSGNANREAELRDLFDTLDPLQAREVVRRLDVNRSDDPLARAFGRLMIERRSRLRAFLADARRRQALRAG